MKILTIIASILLLGIYSCKKEYVCECTQVITEPGYTSNNTGAYQEGSTSVSSVTNNFKAKEKDAEEICNQGEYTNSYPSPNAQDGQGPTVELVTCELK